MWDARAFNAVRENTMRKRERIQGGLQSGLLNILLYIFIMNYHRAYIIGI